MAVGDLVHTPKGWEVTAPTHCPNGHQLGPGRMIVGHQPCGGMHRGGHTCWTCGCGQSVYAPGTGSACRILHGAAGVRNL